MSDSDSMKPAEVVHLFVFGNHLAGNINHIQIEFVIWAIKLVPISHTTQKLTSQILNYCICFGQIKSPNVVAYTGQFYLLLYIINGKSCRPKQGAKNPKFLWMWLAYLLNITLRS